MKTHAIAGILAILLTTQANAEVCRVYEFAELKTFTPSELERMATEYANIAKRIESIPPLTAAELREDMADIRNCTGESERIMRLLNTRPSGKGTR